MNFTIQAHALTTALTYLVNCVEKKQTMPILANVLIELSDHVLTLTTTNLEAEMVVQLPVDDMACMEGATSTEIRKLLQICKATKSDINVSVKNENLLVKYGKTKYKLQSLPVDGFPNIDSSACQGAMAFTMNTKTIEKELGRVNFAMAQGDVRYYLNGMQWLAENGMLRLAGTDGHRLALSTIECQAPDFNVILPRNSVLDVTKLMAKMGETTLVSITDSHIQFKSEGFQYTSKLVDGKYPEIERVIPKKNNLHVAFDKDTLKSLIQQCLIAADDQSRVNLSFENGLLNVRSANNSDTSSCAISTVKMPEKLEISFNGLYLMDAISHVSGDNLIFSLADGNTTSIIKSANDPSYQFIIMPLRA